MKKLLLIISVMGLTFSMSSQNTWTVDNNATAGAQFTSLQAAIDAASPGDFIYVHPSPDSYGTITINKTIHLRGLGTQPELNPVELSQVFDIYLDASFGAPNSTISGLRINSITVGGGNPSQDYSGLQIINNHIGPSGIYGGGNNNSSDNWLIQGNLIEANTTNVINPNLVNDNWVITNNYIQNSTTSFSWVIFQNMNSSHVVRNNIISCNVNNESPWLYNDCNGLELENNILLFSQSSAINVSGSNSSVTYTNCLLYNYSGQTMSDLPGDNNLNNVDPMFLNDLDNIWFYFSGDYQLDPESQGAGYGTDGQDIGIYGNNVEFDMQGYPDDLPFPTDMLISTTQVSNGEILEVEFKAKGN